MHPLDPQVAEQVVRPYTHSPWTLPSLPPTPPPDLLLGSAAYQKMELGNILNAKRSAAALNLNFAMQHTMQAEMQQPHAAPQPQYPPPPYLNGRVKSEAGSDRSGSPHTSDPRYPPPPQQLQYPTMPPAYPNPPEMRYPSPSVGSVGVPMPMPNGYAPNSHHQHQEQAYAQQQQQQEPQQEQKQSTGPPKAFACSTCGKGFARRSDLARHGTRSFGEAYLLITRC